MTRVEQERLVGSYLRGEMTAGQEQEFFIQVALDSDLRQTLKAFRVVETALQKHRDAIVPNHAESYNRLMVMLSASAPEQVTLAGSAAGALLRQGAAVLGSRIFSWTTAVIATGALTIGAFVIGPAVNDARNEAGVEQTKSAGIQATTNAGDHATEVETGEPVRRVERQRGEDVTAGTLRTIPLGTDENGRNSVEKSRQSDVSEILEKGAVAKRDDAKAHETSATTPLFPRLNELDEVTIQQFLTQPTSTGRVRIHVRKPKEEGVDTIKFGVQFDSDGLNKQQ